MALNLPLSLGRGCSEGAGEGPSYITNAATARKRTNSPGKRWRSGCVLSDGIRSPYVLLAKVGVSESDPELNIDPAIDDGKDEDRDRHGQRAEKKVVNVRESVHQQRRAETG